MSFLGYVMFLSVLILIVFKTFSCVISQTAKNSYTPIFFLISRLSISEVVRLYIQVLFLKHVGFPTGFLEATLRIPKKRRNLTS